MNKVIKTPEDYAAALARLHSLLDEDPEHGSPIAEDIELVALLLATYEKSHFDTLPMPTPIEAIRFRMEQLNLAQKDLVKYFGSPSRVSEVLGAKRDLTLPMIRALHAGLGIPADLLISDPPEDIERTDDLLDVSKLPVREMLRRRWLPVGDAHSQDDVAAAARAFVAPVLPYATAFKRTVHFRGGRNIDRHSLVAWLARLWHSAAPSSYNLPAYEPKNVTQEMMRDVVRLSYVDNGPVIAVEFLRRVGICVVIEPSLPRTFLDGATLFAPDRPIVGLTIRFDRLDNFWFVLLHELSHIVLHRRAATLFLDDLESGAVDDAEREADELATKTAIAADAWQRSPASKLRSRQAAEHLAQQLRISPSIVAGRIRRRYNDYSVLNELVGHGEVRRLFPNVQWDNQEEGDAS